MADLELYNHQKEGVKFMIRNAMGCANFSEMGAGKTAMAIVAAHEIAVRTVLVVCPNSLKRNWEKEWNLWGQWEWDIVVLDGTRQKKVNAITAKRKQKHRVVVVNYESLVSLFSHLASMKPDLIIADESHHIKNHKAKKTKALKAIPSAYRWIMTGTPAPNNPLDIWSQYDFIRKGHLMKNFFAFRSVYANVYTGAGFPMIKGYRNLDELESSVARYRFRVLKDDCLDLPDKTFTTIEVELKKNSRKIYDEMLKHMITDIGEEEVTANNALTKMLRLQQITSGFVKQDNGTEVQVGEEKLDALKDLLESLAGQKVVIWAKFNYEIDRIVELVEKLGRKAHVLRGEVKVDERQRRVDEFQGRAGDDIIVSNIAVGGVGLNFTASRYSIYFSNTFSLGDRLQADDRIHRIGQDHKVTYYDLVAEKTIDQTIIKALKRKQKLSDKITGDEFKRLAMGE